MFIRDKHWEFFVYWTALTPLIEPIVADFYPDEHDKRTAVLSHWLASRMSSGGIDYAYDPGAGEDPVLEASEITRSFERLFVDEPWQLRPTMIAVYQDYRYEGEHDPRLLFLDPDPDGFGAPYDVQALGRRVAAAVVEAVADGRVEVSASEPYDSCRSCGGYHNVNYDCDRADDD